MVGTTGLQWLVYFPLRASSCVCYVQAIFGSSSVQRGFGGLPAVQIAALLGVHPVTSVIEGPPQLVSCVRIVAHSLSARAAGVGARANYQHL